MKRILYISYMLIVAIFSLWAAHVNVFAHTAFMDVQICIRILQVEEHKRNKTTSSFKEYFLQQCWPEFAWNIETWTLFQYISNCLSRIECRKHILKVVSFVTLKLVVFKRSLESLRFFSRFRMSIELNFGYGWPFFYIYNLWLVELSEQPEKYIKK